MGVKMAISGLFMLVGDQETKIRANPAAAVDSLVQSVFESIK
eukprot:NODE_11785_length_296_cov_19.785425_g10872_i0.p1 GENE.NODE_11785_length_296_cov_19.785425_g10872_i0~~NODE_11785_length_296_cov_19.785425_g10872_i0.p1  ORF type:complete len:50 (+),score=21.16 NODE_11785_length_296_cov_19.785425_g10872_i0:27-152(+)